MSWRNTLEEVLSLGRQHAGPGSLAGLHEARREHLAQFFTPLPVAKFMWSLVAPAMARATARSQGHCAVIDTSAGSGRLLHFADPDAHVIDGADIHGPSIEDLGAAAKAAGFQTIMERACLSELRFKGYAVALINPPFSIPLASPELEPLPCTTFGRYGPNTGAWSHAYALDQALQGAAIVVSLLPRSQADELPAHALERLVARFHLPKNTFRDEGAEVSTSICLFGESPWGGQVHTETLTRLPDAGPDLGLRCPSMTEKRCARLRLVTLDPSTPAITLPVTGDSRVRVVLGARRFSLKFRCGRTQGYVMNALLREDLPSDDKHRYPEGYRFVGQGVFELHAHLIQPDPLSSVDRFLEEIRNAGGEPELAPGVIGRIKTLMRRNRIGQVPPERWVNSGSAALADGEQLKGVARESFMVWPDRWGSPGFRAGEEVTFTRQGEQTVTTQGGQTIIMSAGEIEKRFKIDRGRGGWRKIHQGREAAFPDAARALRRRMADLGIDRWLTWDHQSSSVVESKLAGRGIVAWRMSLGKARGAIALNLLGGRHNLIVVEPYLVAEMTREFEAVGLTEWKMIDSVAATEQLAKVNLVTYNRLRQNGGIVAKRLRRRMHTVVLDEGDILSNPGSQRSRAVARLAPRETFLLTGTLISNYPRQILPLMRLVWGEGTVLQPYSATGPYLTPALRKSAAWVKRGTDAFANHFVVTEWVTNLFAENLTEGAKREIPMIGDVERFRQWLAPLVSRWTGFEPPVTRYLSIPVPERVDVEVAWDERHLRHYLEVADEFAAWYREQIKNSTKAPSLVTILARIAAVEVAANNPGQGRFRTYHGLTSKDRAVIERAAEHAAAGRKTIVFARFPGLLERLAAALQRHHGIETVVVHGKRSISTRNAELRERFREGSAQVALISTGCGQRGLNLPEAERAIIATGSWTASEQNQMIARLCRAQQKNPVVVELMKLKGSIDEYQHQLTTFKAEAEHVGVDYGDGEMSRDDFKHLDTVLGEFCRDLAELKGVPMHQLKAHLVA